MYLYVFICIYMYLYVFICIYMYLYVFICIYMYLYVFICNISIYLGKFDHDLTVLPSTGNHSGCKGNHPKMDHWMICHDLPICEML